MSRSNDRTCNQCHKKSKDPLHTHHGWLTFKNNAKIVYISVGGYLNFDVDEYDFCSIKCLGDFLERKDNEST